MSSKEQPSLRPNGALSRVTERGQNRTAAENWSMYVYVYIYIYIYIYTRHTCALRAHLVSSSIQSVLVQRQTSHENELYKTWDLLGPHGNFFGPLLGLSLNCSGLSGAFLGLSGDSLVEQLWGSLGTPWGSLGGYLGSLFGLSKDILGFMSPFGWCWPTSWAEPRSFGFHFDYHVAPIFWTFLGPFWKSF